MKHWDREKIFCQFLFFFFFFLCYKNGVVKTRNAFHYFKIMIQEKKNVSTRILYIAHWAMLLSLIDNWNFCFFFFFHFFGMFHFSGQICSVFVLLLITFSFSFGFYFLFFWFAISVFQSIDVFYLIKAGLFHDT